MKIGLVCPYNLYKGGGVQECVRAIREELERRGHKALIITPQPFTNKESSMDNVVFIGTAAQIRSPFHTTAQVSVSVKVDVLSDVLNKEKFDILHFHEPWVPILSRQILARSKSANVATFHAKLPDTIMSRTIEKVITPYTRSVLKDLDCLTAVSDAAAEYVKSLTSRKVNIIPNGINLEEYASRKKHNAVGKPIILYIGRLEKRKGVKYLIEACSLLPEDSYQLILAGDGPDRMKLEQLVEQRGLKSIRFEGYIENDRKLELLSQASVFCSPAIYGESFGIVLLEALSMGTPVVAGDNPGYKAVLKQTGSIGLVNPKDSLAFARTLEIMMNDESIRQLWQNWAKEYVKQFDYSRVVDEYEALYEKVLASK